MTIRERLCQALGCCKLPGEAVTVEFKLLSRDKDVSGEMITIQPGGDTLQLMTMSQIARVKVVALDKNGNPTTFDFTDKNPVWSAADPTVLDVVVSDDNLSATIKPLRPGTSQVNFVADGKFGPGVRDVFGVLEVTVTPNEATVAALEVISVEDVEEPAPTARRR